MIRPSSPCFMKVTDTNEISLPREEFNETFLTIQELLAQEANPEEFIVEDPFISSASVKVDLRKHLQSLYDRMVDIKESMAPSTHMVTIDFS
ncbi:hypothetical protein F7C95_18500 [Opitutia bacterium ISCC 51]|nr:hypothetical protein F7C95_18500 [Opitutae bacterium ISCC 51]